MSFINALSELENLCNVSNTEDPLFCKLHEPEYLGQHNEKHVCLACGLQESLDKVVRFLNQSLENKDSVSIDLHAEPEDNEEIEYAFTIYILLLYLIVEKLHTIFKVIGITWEYVEENWPVLIEIRKWANFVKHPKGFMFTHHPSYIFETLSYDIDRDTIYLTYQDFISKLYFREDADKFKKTIERVANKGNVVVILPCPERIAREFCGVCVAFCEKIKNNEHFKEVLSRHVILDIDPPAP